MSARLETLAAPLLNSEGRPETVVRPVSLAVTAPTISLSSWTVEGEVIRGLTAKTQFAILVLLDLPASGDSR